MKLLDCNWLDFIARLAVWRTLAPSTREIFATIKINDTRPRAAFGADLDVLLRERFLAATTDSPRARLHPDATSFVRAIRAFARNPLLREPTDERLQNYIAEHLNHGERGALIGDALRQHYYYGDDVLRTQLQSDARLREFLALGDARKWERERLRGDPYYTEQADKPCLDDAEALRAAKLIVQLALDARQPIAFDELPAKLESIRRSQWELGLHACLRLMLVFADLDDAGIPQLWIWPPLAARLHRPPPVPPPDVKPVRVQRGFPRLDDLSAVIIALAEEPARIKASGNVLFERDARRLCDALAEVEVPLKLDEDSSYAHPALRMSLAINHGLSQGWLEHIRAGSRGVTYATTDAGRRWLGGSGHERARSLLEPVRLVPGGLDGTTAELFEMSVGSRSALTQMCLTGDLLSKNKSKQPVIESLRKAWAVLDRSAFADLEAWLDFATRKHNPVADERALVTLAAPWSYGSRAWTEEQRELLWRSIVESSFTDLMWPFGGVAVGRRADGTQCIGLTAHGRYLIGATQTIEVDTHATERAAIIVQPNFEIVFLAPSPAVEASLARFCRRRGRGVGALFEITRESCLVAASAGVSAQQALAELAGFSSKPLPQNVEHEMQAWFGAALRVAIEHVDIVRCPDAGAAQRLLSIAGKQARAVSDTIVELVPGPDRAALLRTLRKHGWFVDLPDKGADKPARRAKRRRHSWS